jgi:hypothetical protein
MESLRGYVWMLKEDPAVDGGRLVIKAKKIEERFFATLH